MKAKRILSPLVLLSVLASVAACEYATPYVYRAGEFDRKRRDFGKDPTDITAVTICYHKAGTSPATVTQMAEEQCAKFNKRARFIEHDYNLCPLVTPVAAKYACDPVTPRVSGTVVR